VFLAQFRQKDFAIPEATISAAANLIFICHAYEVQCIVRALEKSSDIHPNNTMDIHVSEYIDSFKGISIIFFFISVLSGSFLNRNAKKKMRAAGNAFSSGVSEVLHAACEETIGSVKAIEKFQSVIGLPGYPPANLWQRLCGGGVPMELLFTSSALVFCEPSASNASMQTTIPLRDIISSRTDYNNASTLVIKLKDGTIYCDTDTMLGAKPASTILKDLLREQKARF